MYAYKPRTQEAEAGASCFEASLGYTVRYYLEKANKQQKNSLRNVSVMKLWQSYRKKKIGPFVIGPAKESVYSHYRMGYIYLKYLYSKAIFRGYIKNKC